MNAATYKRTIFWVSAVSMAANFLLAGFKLTAGLLSGSPAMLSDFVHTLSDVISTVVVIAGAAAASRKADASHPYGHERREYIATVILAFMLAITGGGIAYTAVVSLMAGGHAGGAFSGLAIAAAAVSIAVKEAMYHFTVHYAKKIDSGSLRADAWHHRSDALSSVGSLLGVAFAAAGFPLVDPIAALVIAALILKTAVSLFLMACGKLEDRAAGDSVRARLLALAAGVEGVDHVDMIKTRQFGNRLYADVEISVDGQISTEQSHRIATDVHNRIEEAVCEVKHCMVHVNPCLSKPNDAADTCDMPADGEQDRNSAEKKNEK